MAWQIPIEELRELESYDHYKKYRNTYIEETLKTVKIAMDKTEHEKTLDKMKETFEAKNDRGRENDRSTFTRR